MGFMLMGFIEKIRDIRESIAKQTSSFIAGDQAISNKPLLPDWFWMSKFGRPRGINVVELRQFAKAPFVQTIKGMIKKRMYNTEWYLKNRDEEDETDYMNDINEVEHLLRFPNQNNHAFWDVWGRFIDDVLDLDAGVIWKGRNGAGKIVELMPYDGGRFLFDITANGDINGFYQFSFKFPSSAPKFFEKNDIIYGSIGFNMDTYPYGWAPLQSIEQEIEVVIQGTRYNKEYFKNNAMPNGIVTMNMSRDELERFKYSWEQQVKGKAHKLVFHNSAADFTPMASTNKDMEWLAGQKWYMHVIFAAYGLSPADVGFFENSNRATGESQERVSVKNAVAPYLKLIEEKINREIIPEIVGHDKIVFEFDMRDSAEDREEHKEMIELLKNKVLTVNEVRAQLGMDPVEWGDKPQESFNPFGQQREDLPFSPRREEPKPKREEPLPEETKKSYSPDPFEQDDSASYADFLVKQFRGWEKQIFSFVDETLADEMKIDKSFGEFLSRMLNVVNTSGFFDGLRRAISRTYKAGVSEAEDELDMDIGVTVDFDAIVTTQTNRQLDGFYINGEPWMGLKGVAKDLQKELRELIVKGITEKEGLEKVKENIKDTMVKYKGGTRVSGAVTEGRAMRIARTESSRMHNQGKLMSYQKSGIKGVKKWTAFIDKDTSEECQELNGQTVSLYENFKLNDGREFDAPPGHCNCRSVVEFVMDDE